MTQPNRIDRPRTPPAARGRAVLVGIGRDEDGHVHLTRSEDFRLVGGSASTHAAMLERAQDILETLRRRGLSLRNLTREQFERLQEAAAPLGVSAPNE